MYDGDRFIGSVRKGMDGYWYPELPASRSQKDASLIVITAHDAMRKYGTVPDAAPSAEPTLPAVCSVAGVTPTARG